MFLSSDALAHSNLLISLFAYSKNSINDSVDKKQYISSSVSLAGRDELKKENLFSIPFVEPLVVIMPYLFL